MDSHDLGFGETILEKKDKISKEKLEYYKGLIREDAIIFSGYSKEFNFSAIDNSDIESGPTHPADSNREISDRNSSLASREDFSLTCCNDALDRIKGGVYGICIDCGNEISPPRIEAVHCAIRCAECQKRKEKKRNHGHRRKY